MAAKFRDVRDDVLVHLEHYFDIANHLHHNSPAGIGADTWKQFQKDARAAKKAIFDVMHAAIEDVERDLPQGPTHD